MFPICTLLNIEIFVVAPYLLVTMLGLYFSIYSVVGLRGVLGLVVLAFVLFFLSILFMQLKKEVYFLHQVII